MKLFIFLTAISVAVAAQPPQYQQDYLNGMNYEDDDYNMGAQGMEDQPVGVPHPPSKGHRIMFDENIGDEPPALYSEDQPEIEEGSEQDMQNLRWVLVTSAGVEYQGSFDEVKSMMAEAEQEDDDLVSASEDLDQMLSAMDDGNEPGQGFNEMEKRSVYLPDTRVRVTSIRYPHTAMGQIAVGCTGSFVRSKSVLTAGHCLYNRATRRWYRNLNIQRGKGCGYYQRGITHTWKYAVTVTGYTISGLKAYDYGMIFYNGLSPTWLGFGYDTSIRSGLSMKLSGYPADKGQCLYQSSCRICDTSDADRLKYPCDTSGGMSGSGILLPYKRANIIYGIHTHGGDTCLRSKRCNSGVRITRSKFIRFQNWIKRYNYY